MGGRGRRYFIGMSSVKPKRGMSMPHKMSNSSPCPNFKKIKDAETHQKNLSTQKTFSKGQLIKMPDDYPVLA